MAEEKEAEYYSRDFEWEELRDEIEKDSSLSYHVDPFLSSSSSPPSLESEAWRRFHRRHATGRFFKERRYLLKEFPELVSCGDSVKVLEVGCGNGSTVLPILRASQTIVVYGCDCSEDIIEKAKEIVATSNGVPVKNHFLPFVLDLSVDNFPDWLFCMSCQSSSNENRTLSQDANQENLTRSDPSSLGENQCCVGGVDIVTLIFTLSAVPFNKMSLIIEKCLSVLKPGGLVLFRDYGLYDMTMLRFLPDQRVGYREYMRSDGTLSYFFSLDIVRDLFVTAGFIKLELEYCRVRSVNHRNGKKMRRVWVHGKFQKPI
ncbi:uncharacterized protein [Typha angustifolia]|uniref:uncharacterized protein n=1 Tax=Typha angustifolia TaxID=59011 RepID=UPI003C2F338C